MLQAALNAGKVTQSDAGKTQKPGSTFGQFITLHQSSPFFWSTPYISLGFAMFLAKRRPIFRRAQNDPPLHHPDLGAGWLPGAPGALFMGKRRTNMLKTSCWNVLKSCWNVENMLKSCWNRFSVDFKMFQATSGNVRREVYSRSVCFLFHTCFVEGAIHQTSPRLPLGSWVNKNLRQTNLECFLK